jgi:hypothetical protein
MVGYREGLLRSLFLPALVAQTILANIHKDRNSRNYDEAGILEIRPPGLALVQGEQKAAAANLQVGAISRGATEGPP